MDMRCDGLSFDDCEITLKRIIEVIAKNLRIILLSVIVFGIVMPLGMYFSEVQIYNNSIEVVSSDKNIELSKKEKQEIERYLYLKEKKKVEEEYGENSVYLRMDLQNVYRGYVQCYIDAPNDVKEDIARAIANYVGAPMFAEKFSLKIPSVKTGYITELIGVGTFEHGEGIISLCIYAATEEECVSYVNATLEIIEEYSNSLSEIIASHDLKIIQKDITSGEYKAVFDMYNSYLSDFEATTNQLVAYENAFSKAQKEYISSYVDKSVQVDGEEDEQDKPLFELKNVILGAVVGLLFSIVIIYVWTIAGATIQTEEELYKRFHISNLGMMFGNDENVKNNLINKLLYDKNYSNIDEQIEIISIKLLRYLHSIDVKSVNFISTTEIMNYQSVQKLCAMLKDKNIDCRILNTTNNKKDYYEGVLENYKNIVVEVVGKSKIKNVYKEIQDCKTLNEEIMGYITVIE